MANIMGGRGLLQGCNFLVRACVPGSLESREHDFLFFRNNSGSHAATIDIKDGARLHGWA